MRYRRYKRKRSKLDKFLLKFILYLLIASTIVHLYNAYPLLIYLAILSFLSVKGYKYWEKKRKRQKLLKSGIYDIDFMSGIEFEDYLEGLLKQQGYKVKMTAASNDYGADLILEKERQITVVQAKRYKENVGIKSVQEVIGAMGYYKADKGMVITNSYYTNQALKLAKANSIQMWDREKLINEIIKVKGE